MTYTRWQNGISVDVLVFLLNCLKDYTNFLTVKPATIV